MALSYMHVQATQTRGLRPGNPFMITTALRYPAFVVALHQATSCFSTGMTCKRRHRETPLLVCWYLGTETKTVNVVTRGTLCAALFSSMSSGYCCKALVSEPARTREGGPRRGARGWQAFAWNSSGVAFALRTRLTRCFYKLASQAAQSVAVCLSAPRFGNTRYNNATRSLIGKNAPSRVTDERFICPVETRSRGAHSSCTQTFASRSANMSP